MNSPLTSSKSLQSVLTFDGIDDSLELSSPFPILDKAVTIEFWAKGENSLSQYTSVFAAFHAQNERVLNVHFPWSIAADTARIYWDAGNETGFDRIDKQIKLEEYNSWTHWAFVKDVSTEKLWIYRNGEVWHQGDGQKRPLTAITKFVIGSYASYFWKGSLTEFRIWNKARSQTEIQQNINLRLIGKEAGLAGYYPLNGDANNKTRNGNNGIINGAIWTEQDIPLSRNEPIMAQDKKTPPTAATSAEAPASPAKKEPKKAKPAPKKFEQDTLTTGLSDYGFWSQQVKEEREARKEPDPPFRRGRIWA